MARLRTRWLAIRNRLLADSAFQERASATPIVRTIARRHARDLFDLCAGFVYSQVLLACVRLGVFPLLHAKPQTGLELAAQLGLQPDPMLRLLEAAATLDLVTKIDGDRYTLGLKGAALIANPGIGAMIEHNALLYEDLADPVAFLKENGANARLSRYWAYAQSKDPASLSEADVAAYSTLMSQSQPLVAHEILKAYPFQDHRCLLDAGGGEGRFLIAAGTRHPSLNLMLFDLPAVAERARRRLEAEGMRARAQVFGGNFINDPLPKGADLITLIRIIHDHDDESVLRLLANAREALAKGGTLLIAEPLSDTPGSETVGAAYFGFYLMAMRQGRPRSFRTLAGLLGRAGFTQIKSLPTDMPLQTSVIAAIP